MAYKHNPNHKIPIEQIPTKNKAIYVEGSPVDKPKSAEAKPKIESKETLNK